MAPEPAAKQSNGSNSSSNEGNGSKSTSNGSNGHVPKVSKRASANDAAGAPNVNNGSNSSNLQGEAMMVSSPSRAAKLSIKLTDLY